MYLLKREKRLIVVLIQIPSQLLWFQLGYLEVISHSLQSYEYKCTKKLPDHLADSCKHSGVNGIAAARVQSRIFFSFFYFSTTLCSVKQIILGLCMVYRLCLYQLIPFYTSCITVTALLEYLIWYISLAFLSQCYV